MAYLSVRIKIFAVMLATTLLFGISMLIFAETEIRQKLVAKLQEKCIVIAKRAAADSIDQVITGQLFDVQLMLKELRDSESDLVYAFVLSEDNKMLAHTFGQGVPDELKNAYTVNPMQQYTTQELTTDRGAVLDIGVPLLRGQVGVLRMGFSEDAVNRDVNDIVMLIVVFAVLMVTAGSGMAIGFSNVITRPLLKLAGAADAFGRGEMDQQVSINSDDEIGELAKIFNVMIEKRKRIEEERERLISELQQAMKEVKTLSGLLPVCASCKKVRDDKGYWSELDAYVSKHSGAQISHSICPECTKILYPEYQGPQQQAKRANSVT